MATDGDTFGPLIREHGLGRVVPAQDVEALELALEEMLFDPEAAAAAVSAVRAFAGTFAWSRVLQPLVEFCRYPRRAADLAVDRGDRAAPRRRPRRPRRSLSDDVTLARGYLRAGGIREVTRRALGRVRRVLGRGAARG